MLFQRVLQHQLLGHQQLGNSGNRLLLGRTGVKGLLNYKK